MGEFPFADETLKAFRSKPLGLIAALVVRRSIASLGLERRERHLSPG
jgi:hypothetical protein